MVLYYELYVTGGVATLQLQAFHMSFGFYTFFIAASNLLSAFGAPAASLCDRFGRANLVVYGLLATGLLILGPRRWASGCSARCSAASS